MAARLLRSAKRDRQSSSERARSASERELDLFPLLEIESSDVILARTFQTFSFVFHQFQKIHNICLY